MKDSVNPLLLWGVFILFGAGVLYLMYRVWASSTAPPGNLPNTGKRHEPPPPVEPKDNRPKPPEPPRKEQI